MQIPPDKAAAEEPALTRLANYDAQPGAAGVRSQTTTPAEGDQNLFHV
jgi:hypothetical protein